MQCILGMSRSNNQRSSVPCCRSAPLSIEPVTKDSEFAKSTAIKANTLGLSSVVSIQAVGKHDFDQFLTGESENILIC